MIAASARLLSITPICLLSGLLALIVGSARAETLQVGIDPESWPLSYADKDGKPRGLAVDVVEAVAREMQCDVAVVAQPWTTLDAAFRRGEFDLLANVSYTDERADYMRFSAPHVLTQAALFFPANHPPIRQLKELRDLRIAVKSGSPGHHYLIAHGWWQHLVVTGSPLDSLRAVANAQADVALEALPVGQEILRRGLARDLAVSPLPLTELTLRYQAAFHLDHEQLLQRFNAALARLSTSGELDRIRNRWIVDEPRQLDHLRPYLWLALPILVGGVGLLLWQRRMLRRQALQAEALRRSEERLNLVLAGTEDGFWDWDLTNNRIDRSEHWAGMLGYTLAEIEPTLAAGRALVHPDDLAAFDYGDPRHVSDRQHLSRIEFRMRTKSGAWRWILCRGKVVSRAPDGTPLRMAGTHTDVTDLRLARDEAARLEARFRVVFENSPVGLSWMRAGQDETRFANLAYERITGITTAEARRNPAAFRDATHPDDRPIEAEIRTRLASGKVSEVTLEKRYVHRDGRVVPAMLTIYSVKDAVLGETYLLTTLVDLSERKRTESDREALNAKLLEAQKLESLGVLAGGIAHDFNNLLTVILANAAFAREEGSLAEARVEPIETAARRAADLCRQMLAYAGKASMVLSTVALDTLVRESSELLKVSLSKKAHLRLDLPADLPPVEADLSQLRQVVMNLVINAAEAIGEADGEIRLALRLARPESATGLVHNFNPPPGDCVCLEVIDTGPGMSLATLSRIFDPFFTTKFAGRGLGLPAVLGIVRAHHGALAVESTQGRGTIFRVYLPAARRAPPRPAAPAARPSPTGEHRGTILIADDEPAVLATVDIIVRRHGYQTVLATNGNEAVQRFTDSPDRFAAVVLDLTMPGRDGAEVLAAIRAERAVIPVLVMSGFSETDILERLRGCGEVVILRKPFLPDQLLERLAATLAGPQD